jgi:tRNA threonylcarbamoyladenosine modification (KEOPS) complex  Pcc1 subunit
MNTFIVVATFKPNTNMQEVFAVVNEERAQVAVLRSASQLGFVHLSLARSTVFLEILAADETQARAVVNSLPMSRWWDLDLYPTVEPTLPNQASV